MTNSILSVSVQNHESEVNPQAVTPEFTTFPNFIVGHPAPTPQDILAEIDATLNRIQTIRPAVEDTLKQANAVTAQFAA